MYPPAGVKGGTGATVGAPPPVYPINRGPRRPASPWYPNDNEDDDPNQTGIGAGSTNQPGTGGSWGTGAVDTGPVKLDPFADVNYQGLVSALAKGEDEARNDATFQSNQIDNQQSRALAELQRAYMERRGNLTSNVRARGAYDSSQRAALTGRLYEGEQRDADGVRIDASGKKGSIQQALARMLADYTAQRSRGALDAAGRLQAAEDARLGRDQMRQYQDMMSQTMASQQLQLLAALEALMGGGQATNDGSGASAPSGNTTPSWRPGDPVFRPVAPIAAAGGEPIFSNGVMPRPNNAFGSRFR